MNKLEIKETANTPHVLLDSGAKKFLIEGKSFPEDNKEFYTPIFNWIDEYKNENPSEFTISINLYYLSSSSVISIKQLLMRLVEYKNQGVNVKVVWCYDEDDDDIKKTGEDYRDLTKLDFVMHVNEG